MGSQRSYLEDQIDDRDDADDDEYWLIRDAVDAVDVYVDCMRTSSSQCVQSLVSISRLILTLTMPFYACGKEQELLTAGRLGR